MKQKGLSNGQRQEECILDDIQRQEIRRECPDEENEENANSQVCGKKQEYRTRPLKKSANRGTDSCAVAHVCAFHRVVCNKRSECHNRENENRIHAKGLLDVSRQTIVNQCGTFFDDARRQPKSV